MYENRRYITGAERVPFSSLSIRVYLHSAVCFFSVCLHTKTNRKLLIFMLLQFYLILEIKSRYNNAKWKLKIYINQYMYVCVCIKHKHPWLMRTNATYWKLIRLLHRRAYTQQ